MDCKAVGVYDTIGFFSYHGSFTTFLATYVEKKEEFTQQKFVCNCLIFALELHGLELYLECFKFYILDQFS